VGSSNELIAALDSTTAPGELDLFLGMESHVIAPDVGFSSILGWDEKGWQVLWVGGSADEAITYMHVSDAYDEYRLWWAQDQSVYWMALPRDIINPNEVTTFAYAASADHDTPWFDAEQSDIDKSALELRVEVQKATSTETVVVAYALNYAASSFTTLGTISSNGITSYLFPNSTTPTGTAFRSIRFRLTFARGSTTTLSPDVVSLTFIFRKKLPAKYKFTVPLDLGKPHGGREVPQLRSAFVTAIEATNLVEFTFRDDTGNTRNYYVDIIAPSSFEQSGYDEQGRSVVTMAER
jgi:hypothetical protein